MRTVIEIAQDALKNFDEMTMEMASFANGNDSEYSVHWPIEEDLFPPILEYLNKNRELKKELEGICINVSSEAEVIEELAKKLLESDGFVWDAKDFNETADGQEPEEQREYWREKAKIAFDFLYKIEENGNV